MRRVPTVIRPVLLMALVCTTVLLNALDACTTVPPLGTSGTTSGGSSGLGGASPTSSSTTSGGSSGSGGAGACGPDAGPAEGSTCEPSTCTPACALGTSCTQNGCSDWASRPMPNPPATGLPNPSSYSVGPGVVVDNITTLIWQEPIVDDAGTCSDGCTYQDAVTYCDGLTIAGSTWRVPTRIELVSLLDYTQTNGELIDPAYFQSTSADCFWTSTPFTGSTNMWVFDFQTGAILQTAVSTSCHVRCVH
jgi:hypothetical protein